jgi:hypothetical protein
MRPQLRTEPAFPIAGEIASVFLGALQKIASARLVSVCRGPSYPAYAIVVKINMCAGIGISGGITRFKK